MPEGNPYNLGQIMGFLTSRIFQKVKAEISSLTDSVGTIQSNLSEFGMPSYVNLPVGTLVWNISPSLSSTKGFLACDGTQYNASGYPELSSLLGVDNDGMFTVPTISPETKGTTTLYPFIKHEKTSY